MIKITVLDGTDVPEPENIAMLQALQSRDPSPVADRLEKLKARDVGSWLERYYIGYNHKSIGDCGTTTIFIEGVTMLAAKAIQDWALYSGQEASTRYMDFSESEFHNPLGTLNGKRIQEDWRRFYLESMGPVKDYLYKRYPYKDGESRPDYDRAIKARVFDIARSFLPAGAATNLSWHTNLRQAADHLGWLIYHPDISIQEIAKEILKLLQDKYTGSFKDRPLSQDQSNYKALVAKRVFLENIDSPHSPTMIFGFDWTRVPNMERRLLSDRPKGVEVPRFLAELGNITSEFVLDFGSYRDLQRHRSGIIRMPLLSTKLGFHEWYLEELPDSLLGPATDLIARQTKAIESLECNDVTRQSYCAMGFKVPCRVTQGLPGLVYRLEQRSGKMVHPTLRSVIHEEIKLFREIFPEVALYVDEDPDSWSVRRGGQTIKEKS